MSENDVIERGEGVRSNAPGERVKRKSRPVCGGAVVQYESGTGSGEHSGRFALNAHPEMGDRKVFYLLF